MPGEKVMTTEGSRANRCEGGRRAVREEGNILKMWRAPASACLAPHDYRSWPRWVVVALAHYCLSIVANATFVGSPASVGRRRCSPTRWCYCRLWCSVVLGRGTRELWNWSCPSWPKTKPTSSRATATALTSIEEFNTRAVIHFLQEISIEKLNEVRKTATLLPIQKHPLRRRDYGLFCIFILGLTDASA